jgi:hypothetical protein
MSVSVLQGRFYPPSVETVLSKAAQSDGGDAQDIISGALVATFRRFAAAPTGSLVYSRLERRIQDLQKWQAYFQLHPSARLKHVVGFGEGCSAKVSPRQGISEFDGFEYVDAKGKTRVERISSAYALFDPSSQDASPKTITKGGVQTAWLAGERTYLRGMKQHRDLETSALHPAPNQAVPHTKHAHHPLTGVCVCGRGVSAALGPQGGAGAADEHGKESSLEHSLEQIQGSRLEPSVLGLVLGVLFLCVKIPLDVYQAFKIRALSRVLKTHAQDAASVVASSKPPVLLRYAKDQHTLAKDTLRSYPYRLFQNGLFYTGAIAGITGHVQAFVSAGATGALAVGIGALAFGALGFFACAEGLYGLWRIRKVKVQHEGYQKSMDQHVRSERLKAVAKTVGGGCMVVGMCVPGAQPLLVLGAVILMAPLVVLACKWVYRKCVKPVPHQHLAVHDKADVQTREWAFQRMRHVEGILKAGAERLRVCDTEEQKHREKLTTALAYHRLMRDDAERRLFYLEQSYAYTEQRSKAYGEMCKKLITLKNTHQTSVDALRKGDFTKSLFQNNHGKKPMSEDVLLRFLARGQRMLMDELCQYTFQLASSA